MTKNNDGPAVLATESIHVTIAPKPKESSESNGNGKTKKSPSAIVNIPENPGPKMRTVELNPVERIHEGFGRHIKKDL